MKMSLTLEVELSDGTTHTVQTTNRDMIRYELTANKQRWPRFDDGGGFLGMTFMAWSAMKAEGTYTENWETFSEKDCVSVSPADTGEDNEELSAPF